MVATYLHRRKRDDSSFNLSARSSRQNYLAVLDGVCLLGNREEAACRQW